MSHPTKLDNLWHRPYLVSGRIGTKYKLFDPETGKYNEYHLIELK